MWQTLIPIGATLLGGILDSRGNETTSRPWSSPELEAAAREIFSRAMETFSKDYPHYGGERVAGPTAARGRLDKFLPQIEGAVSGGMNAANRYSGKIDQLLRMKPANISVPTLTGDSVQSSQRGGYYGAGGLGTGGGWSDFDASAFVQSAMPQRQFDPSRVAFDPKVK